MTCERGRGSASGFSLVELMVAMTITLIISGAIYGLLAGGQSAFQREPALTDRQQNARIAMDLIEHDVANAGRGLPLVAQAFSDGLDQQGPGPGGAANLSDVLELVLSDPQCPTQSVCNPPGAFGDPGPYVTREAQNGCLNPVGGGDRPLLLVADGFRFSVHPNINSVPDVCPGGANNLRFQLGPPYAGFNTWGAGAATASPSAVMYGARIVRYQLQPEADGVLSLVRSDVPGANPQVVARGIEDLQVQYLNAAGWANAPGPVGPCAPAGCAAADYAAVVRQVRVSILARTIGGRVPGDNKIDRIRYSTVTAPRAAVAAIENAANEGYEIFN